MNTGRSYCLGAAACLLLILAGVARAELGEAFIPLTNGPVPPFQGAVLESDGQNYLVHYPVLSVGAVDRVIKDWALGAVADAPPQAVEPTDGGDSYTVYEMQASYSLSASTPRYFSVVFFTTQAIMERRENLIYTLNFDLQTRKLLDISAIFEDLEQALPLLPPLIIKAADRTLNANHQPVELPYYVTEYNTFPDEFSRFLTVAFCPEGLNVYLSATDMVLLTKDDLIAAGAAPKFWTIPGRRAE